MAEQHYDLFFSGDLIDGFFVDFVKADIQTLFKANEAYIGKLFSGQEQLIKKRADKATAIKFQQAFKKAGAKLIVRPHNPAPTVATAPTAAEKPAAAQPQQPNRSNTVSGTFTTTMTTVDGENAANLIEAHQADIHAPSSIPNWDISAPGVQLVEATPFVPAQIDTSALTVADVGTDLIVNKGFESPAPTINTEAITLAEPGGDIETLDDKPPPVQVDISHLSLK